MGPGRTDLRLSSSGAKLGAETDVGVRSALTTKTKTKKNTKTKTRQEGDEKDDRENQEIFIENFGGKCNSHVMNRDGIR